MITVCVSAIDRIADLVPQSSTASGPLKVALAVTIGLVLGSLRIRGFRLGVSAVLFAALALAQIGVVVNAEVLAFTRDFSLILFVYVIGLQVGPAFFSSFRSEGLVLNLLTIGAVVLASIFAAVIALIGWIRPEAASGLFAGSLTTTPGLAAGQDALRQVLHARPNDVEAARSLVGLAYAVSYPLGVVGPSFVIALLQRIFSIRIDDERTALAASEVIRRPPVKSADFKVTNAQHAEQALRKHPLLQGRRVVLSRLVRSGVMSVPNADTVIRLEDVYRAAGLPHDVDDLIAALGEPTVIDSSAAGAMEVQRMEIVVTKPQVLRRPLRDLDLSRRTGVTIARVHRAGIDLVPTGQLSLKFGDLVVAIGPADGLKVVEIELGNSQDTLNRPQLLPIFLGIVLGVIIGSIPLAFPGLKAPMRIGLAGGPMLAAIALSQLGNIGSVVWYMPMAASQLVRDLGLAVFLACVGFETGDHFLQHAVHGGVAFIAWGLVVTIVPVLAVGWLARLCFKTNFITLSGWVAGAMTSTPGLVFACELCGSDAPSVAYATVAPLGMLVPVICAQLMVIALVR